jgi:hypothetical protein
VQNGLIGSAWACVTTVTRFALLQDFDSSRRHPSGREVYLTFTLKKIGMAFEGFIISAAENRLSLRCAVVALQKCFVGFCGSK